VNFLSVFTDEYREEIFYRSRSSRYTDEEIMSMFSFVFANIQVV